MKLWLMPVWCLLGLMRALILLWSFNRLVRTFGRQAALEIVPPVLSDRQKRLAEYIGRTVRGAAAWTPWQSNCFPQALCASLLLRLYRVPFVTYLGLMRDPATKDMKAHAWIVAGPASVTGGVKNDHYTVVGAFAP